MRASVATALALTGIVGACLVWATPAQAAVAPCTGDRMTARVTGADAGMSEQVVYVTVRNRAKKRCYVSGYPFLARVVAKGGSKAFTQVRGGTALAQNPPRKRIILKRGQRAHFVIGASTAYDTKPITVRRVRFAPAPGVTPISVDVRLDVDRAAREPYRLTTTAYAPGAGKVR